MEVLTAAQAEPMQRRIAGGLSARGVTAGDRVLLTTSSTPAMLTAVLGALRVGIVPVVVNSGLLAEERAALAADAEPALEVDDAVLAALLEGPEAELAPWPLARPMHYTSGTTGQPKGVWSGLLDEAEAAALLAEEREQWGFDAGDRHLVCSPFHHAVSIRFGGGTLLAGGTVIVLGRFDAAAALAAVREAAPTTSFMVPAHLQRIHATAGGTLEPLGALRRLVHAGSPCPPPLQRAAIDALGADRVWEFYGSTEGQFTACSAREWLERPGTVGRARVGRRLAVAPVRDDELDGDDPTGRGRELAATGTGVVWCAPPSWARFTYWRDPDKTAGAWRERDGADWFTVGDLGRLDEDGYLFLEGRRADLIITGGVNVYPAEVERTLVEAPGVAEVAVVGLPDERWGQRVCAAVVGAAAGPPVDPDAVLAFAREHLAGHKRPKEVHVVEALPHTSTGKVQRTRVADDLAAR